MNTALREVNSAYAKYHSSLERMREKARTDTLRTDLANADTMLKLIRTQADQQIHSFFTCGTDREETKDTDKDVDHDVNDEADNDENNASASPSASPSPTPTATPTASPSPSASPLVTGSDAKSVADNAVAAMKLVFDTVSAEFQSASPAPTHRPESTNGGFGRDSGHDGGDRD